MVLHSDFAALPLSVSVLRCMDRSFEYHPKKPDGTRDETRTERVNRRLAICQYTDVQGVLGFCILLPCRDWLDCSFDGLTGQQLHIAVVQVEEDRDTAMPIFRISGFEVAPSPARELKR